MRIVQEKENGHAGRESLDKLYHSAMCFEETLRVGALVKRRKYTDRVECALLRA